MRLKPLKMQHQMHWAWNTNKKKTWLQCICWVISVILCPKIEFRQMNALNTKLICGEGRIEKHSHIVSQYACINFTLSYWQSMGALSSLLLHTNIDSCTPRSAQGSFRIFKGTFYVWIRTHIYAHLICFECGELRAMCILTTNDGEWWQWGLRQLKGRVVSSCA